MTKAIHAAFGAGIATAALVLTITVANVGEGEPALTDRQQEIAERGKNVMPFDLDETSHHFEKVPDGLIQTVAADDPDDAVQLDLVRQHLNAEADRFRLGDFESPAAIHGRSMPGLAELRTHGERISIGYQPTTAGARIVYSTTDPILVNALHRWADAQVTDHGAHAEGG